MTERQREQLAQLAALLGSAPLNLLSRGDREHVWDRHVGESLRIREALSPRSGEHWLDLGTGGGLPGLVLAIMSPDARFTLLDSRGRKIEAVAGFIDALGLENVEALVGRAETLAREPGLRGGFDAVISRALGGLPTVVELSRGFLKDGGTLIAVRGANATDEAAALRALLPPLGVGAPHTIRVSGTERDTWLVTMRAAGRPPERFPRSDGMPAARPLGTHGS